MNTKRQMDFSTKRIKALAIVLVGGAFVTIALDVFLSSVYANQAQNVSREKAQEELRAKALATAGSFAGIALEARAAFVFDLSTNLQIFARSENEKLPLASLTKIMSAVVAEGQTGEDVIITITADDLLGEGDSGLRPGERFRRSDISDFMLIASSNDAARALATFVGSDGQGTYDSDLLRARENFIQMMNDEARVRSFTSMKFTNESGLDSNQAHGGGYGSAREIALLLADIVRKSPNLLEATTRKEPRIVSVSGVPYTVINTNEIVGRIPGLIASKTGYTALAGGNLAVVFDIGIGHLIVAVVLGSGYEGRFRDMEKLVAATRTLFSN